MCKGPFISAWSHINPLCLTVLLGESQCFLQLARYFNLKLHGECTTELSRSLLHPASSCHPYDYPVTIPLDLIPCRDRKVRTHKFPVPNPPVLNPQVQDHRLDNKQSPLETFSTLCSKSVHVLILVLSRQHMYS